MLNGEADRRVSCSLLELSHPNKHFYFIIYFIYCENIISEYTNTYQIMETMLNCAI